MSDEGRLKGAPGAAVDPAAFEALYQDALQLRADLDALIARLAALTRAAVPPAPPAVVLAPPAAVATSEDVLPSNGVDGRGGRYLVRVTRSAAREAAGRPVSSGLRVPLRARATHFGEPRMGTVSGVDPARLADARWAVVVHEDDPATLLEALAPLIVHRAEAMGLAGLTLSVHPGETCGAWIARHTSEGPAPPVLGYRAGQTCAQWLRERNVSHGPVEPTRGVPYYLLLASRPGPVDDDHAFIPFAFQYELDVFWAVGRICCTDAKGRHRMDDYRRFAERLVARERRGLASAVAREAIYVATAHPGDEATQLSAAQLVAPLAAWHRGDTPRPRPAALKDDVVREVLPNAAYREALREALGGAPGRRPPALVFTATHGIGLPADDPELPMLQGALLTQEWGGEGAMDRGDFFAAEDLPEDPAVAGTLAVLFACFSGGCPEEDEFVFDSGADRPRIAPFALVSQLAQRLLRAGAAGVIGHVDRAWSTSFQGVDGASSQTQAYQDLIGRALSGERLGHAMDAFNVLHTRLAATLADALEKIGNGADPTAFDLDALWIARNDARNVVLLGDPAARVAVPGDDPLPP